MIKDEIKMKCKKDAINDAKYQLKSESCEKWLIYSYIHVFYRFITAND